MSIAKRPVALPKHFPQTPASYPLALFRQQLAAAGRYLFEGELREALTAATIPLDAWTGAGDPALNVAQVSAFIQELQAVIGPEKAAQFGHEAMLKMLPLLPKSTLPSLPRAVSSADKLFLRVREAMAVLNRQSGSNFMVKWHGGAESDIFEDTGQNCYGYQSQGVICHAMTGCLQEAISSLAGVKTIVVESECMAAKALACRWHCRLA